MYTPTIAGHIIRRLYAVRIPLALVLGAIDAWAGRGSFMAGDTVSYMDMAHGIATGDLARAINGYWSPLYPLLVSLFVRPFVDDPAAQFAAVRLANFLVFAATIGLFELFLRRLVDLLQPPPQVEEGPWSPLPRQHFVVGAYAAFLWACLSLNMVARISPDNLVLAVILLVAILIMQLERTPASLGRFALLGLVLGLGYWVKAILFPAGAIMLVATCFSPGLRGRKKLLVLSAGVFAVICVPLMIALSQHCGRITFGETGRLNYAWLVNGVAHELHWQGGVPGQGTPVHPTRKIHSQPDVFEFATPLDATYPPWAEASYWYAGVTPQLNIPSQVKAVGINILRLGRITFSTYFLAALLVLLGWAWWKISKWREFAQAVLAQRHLWLALLGPIGLYALVFVLDRYIAGQLLLAAVLLIALLRVTGPHWANRVVLVLVATCALSVGQRLVPVVVRVAAQKGDIRDYRWKVAEEFARLKLPAHTPVASIGGVAFDDWAYPAQARVVTEIVGVNNRKSTGDLEKFWQLTPAGRDEILNLMRGAGARVVVCNEFPAGADLAGWTPIASSPYIYRVLEPAAR